MVLARTWSVVCLVMIASGCDRSPSAAASLAPSAPSARAKVAAGVDGTTPPATAAAHAPSTALAQTNADMIEALKPSIVGHVTLDGDLVSDLRQADACHTVFTTSRGATTIAWSQVGNVVTHLVGGRQETGLKTGGVSHDLSAPTTGPDADPDGIRGALGQLAGECGAY